MKNRHLRDDELLLLVVNELPGWLRSRSQTHFAKCDICRRRSIELETAIGKAAVYQEHLVLFEALKVRARLIEKMSGPAVQESAGSRGALFASRRTWHAVNACLALLIATALLWSARTLGPRIPAAWIDRSHGAALPIKRLTPGATRDARLDNLCSNQDPDNDRAIDTALAQRVFQEYGLPVSKRSAYEVDFLITPGLGGSDDIRNLWPEPYESTVWNAHVKNRLETHLHKMVCAGRVPLSIAQAEMATDWISAYKRYFHTQRPDVTLDALDN